MFLAIPIFQVIFMNASIRFAAAPSALAVAAALLSLSQLAQAHISYSGRNLGTVTAGSSNSIATQSVTSNYGWADASDASLVFNSTLATTARTDTGYVGSDATDALLLGDSHKGRAFRFRLDSALAVTFTAASRNDSGLTAAFSVYQGLVAASPFTAPQTSADHDYAPASQAWRTSFAQGVVGAGYTYLATQGSWNALGNWSVGGDGDPAGVPGALDVLQFVGYGASTVANGVATATFALGPGDYTVFVGGNDITAKSLANSTKAYAFTLGVSAVPEPESLAMALVGLVCVGGLSFKRKQG
jgi:hypothetical protein